MERGTDVVITVRCADADAAGQALSLLRTCDAAGQIELRGGIVIERAPDDRLQMPADPHMVAGVATGGGSLIGMLMDILGGPLGMLLGWRGAAVIAAAVDLRMAERTGELGGLAALSVSSRIGKAVVLADITEFDPEIIDSEMATVGGTVIRRPADLVLAELAAAEDAAKAAEMEAVRVLRQQHIAERRKGSGHRDTFD
ncbi:hypothetical protein ABN034_22960 [Actinopolymorpha sp. B11F2]|uniref:hypothetical protein n=1 Tax=Actinopolymorpha sp. B11F2 TaxID=3160862 RepID=UPI0032E44E52